MAVPATSRAGTYTDDYVCNTLASLEIMPLPQLRTFWAERWGAPPAYRTRDQLMRAAAWKLQADVHGGVTAKVRREVAELGARFNADRGFTPGPSVSLMPGMTLIREWGGKRHEVAVLEEGFVYDGRHFGSLSAAALFITGTQWNGPVFFGVKARKPRAPSVVGGGGQ